MMEGDGLPNGPGCYFSVHVSLLCGFDSLFLFYSSVSSSLYICDWILIESILGEYVICGSLRG